MRWAAPLALLLLGAAPGLPITAAQVVATLPHDPGAYTEGLFIDRGELFESTGEVGRSSVRKVKLETGAVLARATVPPPYFGEGIAPWGDQILSLTWKDGVGFRWSRDGLKRIGRFSYRGEGWALTSDGQQLIMSDGTAVLRFVDPAQFRVTRRLRVTAYGQPVTQLNEIEYVDGEILANVWLTDTIVRIDPTTGAVKGLIDVSALHAQAGVTGYDDVANGIAWDAERRRLFVTGKRWPYLFEIAPPPRG
ncbi:glutaminyl-peptide cyclotransferase [Sphingomonas sp.]|uniref:glutaminyl-peptide cyclotransferase n=1 Tax=Sphingomonas sp. TaxID=28214 RepID=UPI001E176578|nr:glutaminyl-peptide cyclotransferase [Sphingomonas sp.]MBX9796609.1 glutaminyl-peptide cyclotransferase [Sphingomonas sp.]